MSTSRVLLVSAGTEQTTTANTATHFSLGNTGLDAPSPTESVRHILFRTPGLLSQLYVRVTANSIAANSTILIRNNGTDTSLSLSVGSNATGVFQDTTNIITIAAGDKLSFRFVPGASTGTMTIAILAVCFDTESDTATVTRLVSGGVGISLATASGLRYNTISGEMSGSNVTESQVKARIRTSSISKNLAVNISANNRTTDTTFRTRKNGANGNMSVVVGPGATGWFEDITNSDSLVAGDDYNTVIETLTGTETMSVRCMCVDMETTTSKGFLINARTNGFLQTPNTTNYFVVAGNTVTGSTENNRKVKALDTFTLSDLTLVLTGNSLTASSTLTVRKNGIDTALAITIPATTAGVITNSSDSVSFTANDEVSLALVTGATGTSLSFRTISINTVGRQAYFSRTLSETKTIAETRARQKATWRLQP